MSQTKSPAAPPAKPAAKVRVRVAAAELTPAKPEGYTPQGEVKVLAEAGGIRVVSDDARVWKEPAE